MTVIAKEEFEINLTSLELIKKTQIYNELVEKLKPQNISQESLDHFIVYVNLMPKAFYKKFFIKKKNGSKRLIEEPVETLKQIQRTLIPLIHQYYILPSCCYGVGGGGMDKNAIANAEEHVCSEVIVKMDIKDFFFNTNLNDYLWAIHNSPQAPEDLYIANSLCFINDNGNLRLPTGAPTSPLISTIAFGYIDKQLKELAIKHNMKYTRYIDDLTFSGYKYPDGFQKKVNKIVISNGYEINHNKSQVLYRNNNSQNITGVCINHKPTVGKKYKQKLRAELDRYAREGLEIDDYMQGKLNYVKQVEFPKWVQFRKYFLKRKKRYQQLETQSAS